MRSVESCEPEFALFSVHASRMALCRAAGALMARSKDDFAAKTALREYTDAFFTTLDEAEADHSVTLLSDPEVPVIEDGEIMLGRLASRITQSLMQRNESFISSRPDAAAGWQVNEQCRQIYDLLEVEVLLQAVAAAGGEQRIVPLLSPDEMPVEERIRAEEQ
ncbi:MAG TPA: hypothetical protein VF733_01240 [Candidatus Saccharimonadales bacterium]